MSHKEAQLYFQATNRDLTEQILKRDSLLRSIEFGILGWLQGLLLLVVVIFAGYTALNLNEGIILRITGFAFVCVVGFGIIRPISWCVKRLAIFAVVGGKRSLPGLTSGTGKQSGTAKTPSH